MRLVGNVPQVGDIRIAHRVLVRKPKNKRPTGKSRCIWENNIKMDLEETD
jgi:hypothetical protein